MIMSSIQHKSCITWTVFTGTAPDICPHPAKLEYRTNNKLINRYICLNYKNNGFKTKLIISVHVK